MYYDNEMENILNFYLSYSNYLEPILKTLRISSMWRICQLKLVKSMLSNAISAYQNQICLALNSYKNKYFLSQYLFSSCLIRED
jgi:hypothetical protein